MKSDLTNKSVIVTGGSEGLGLKIAEVFLKAGANVMICSRQENKIHFAINTLMPFCKDNTVIGSVANIAVKNDCESIVAHCLEKFKRLDILINNAGIHGAKGSIDTVDWDAWESAIDTNLKGSAYLSHVALPHMKKQQSGKIIFISGGGATKPMPFMSAYAASKAAIVRFGECLAEEVNSFGIDVNMVSPGALNTYLLEDVLNAGPELVGEEKYQQALKQKESGGDNPERAAQLCLFLASEKSNGITGKLISAIWDPWENLPLYRDDLMHSDIYTLRRIIPADRNKEWTSC